MILVFPTERYEVSLDYPGSNTYMYDISDGSSFILAPM